ncbi:MAG: PQQ-dependent sugar dehydrogenase [Opitutaceae bacterium]|nr:PQQ-dependent sugar dehydrogenase [Opitutaceae bacterium]
MVEPDSIYPLTPLQHGMLFHSLAAPRSGVDIEQMLWDLPQRQLAALKRVEPLVALTLLFPFFASRAAIWLSLLSSCFVLPFALAQPYGITSRPSIGPYLNNLLPSGAPVAAGAWQTVKAFPNLTFATPTFLVAEPNSNRLLVGGDQGLIWVFDNNPSASTKNVYLDLRAHCQGYNGSGLLGLAFHPEYGKAGSPNRGFLYVSYQYTPGPVKGSPDAPPDHSTTPSYNRISRFWVQDGYTNADLSSEFVLINQFDRHLWHGGGAMFFGLDGFLYVTVGDEGGQADDYDQSQRIDLALFGGVLRIDVDNNPSRSHPIRRQPRSATTPPAGWPATYSAGYSIPNDNPFLDPSGGILEEFWCIGLRSPHRMTQDPTTGQVWVGDVGNGGWEEIDLIQKGANYQWPWREGDHPGFKPQPFSITGVSTAPFYNYSHDKGNNCVIGGYVYRGSQFAAQLTGRYIFGDNISNRIWFLDPYGPPTQIFTELTTLPPGVEYIGGLSSFGLDRNSELYMCTTGETASIYKLQYSGLPTPPLPPLLSQTGAFSDVKTLAPATGVIPYTVNVPFWSDGAAKSRWLAVPTGTAIRFSPTGEWTFPSGTVFIKHFELPVDDRNPAIRRRLETRLIVRDSGNGIYAATYKWRADNSDADLLPGALSENLTIATAGGTRTQTWDYPSPHECMLCHNPNANSIIGVRTRQLNGTLTYPATGVSDNQLRTLSHIGLFDPAVSESGMANYARLAPLTDTSASVVTRVRSYLDANCAQCHRPNGGQTFWDARFDTPLEAQGIVDGKVENNHGIVDARVVAPGSLSRSLLYLRMNSTDSHRMPPLGRNLIDAEAVALIASYISTVSALPVLQIPGHLTNISGRAVAGTGNQTLIAGFVVGGSGTKTILVRGIGPALIGFGLGDALSDTVLKVVNAQGSILLQNDNWGDGGDGQPISSTAANLAAFSLAAGSRDAAALVTLAPGAYTAQVTGVGGASGVALAEVYDANPSSTAAILTNFSLRTQVGTAANILIAGFVVGGELPVKVLIRGIGPSLAQFGVGGVLVDPQLNIFNSVGTAIASNDNWSDVDAANLAETARAVGAFALTVGSRDATLLLTLAPGAYTAHLMGVANATGVGMIELYTVP